MIIEIREIGKAMIEAIAFAALYVVGGMQMAMVVETDEQMMHLPWSIKSAMIAFWFFVIIYAYVSAGFSDE